MRTYVGTQEARDAVEFGELACGDYESLFLGPWKESPEQAAARAAAARDILDELGRQGAEDGIAAEDADYARELHTAGVLLRRALKPARMRWATEGAA